MYIAGVENFAVPIPTQASVVHGVSTVSASSFPSPPSWWRNNIDYADFILIGGGGGGGGYFNAYGSGGKVGSWASFTVQTLSGLFISVGAGGSGGSTQAGNTGNHTYATDSTFSGGQVNAAGGVGGVYGNGNWDFGWYGQGNVQYSYQGRTVVSGATEQTGSTAGNAPGGGGAGSGGAFQNGGNGGVGGWWLTFRQNTNQLTAYPPLFT